MCRMTMLLTPQIEMVSEINILMSRSLGGGDRENVRMQIYLSFIQF